MHTHICACDTYVGVCGTHVTQAWRDLGPEMTGILLRLLKRHIRLSWVAWSLVQATLPVTPPCSYLRCACVTRIQNVAEMRFICWIRQGIDCLIVLALHLSKDVLSSLSFDITCMHIYVQDGADFLNIYVQESADSVNTETPEMKTCYCAPLVSCVFR